uniref:ABC transmembrane transporter permease n=1 Tax=uncultured organism TaxID=155900 RepID=D8VMX0_9ZZZZ|nr:ABC transmembrane transporter permease [uncultured organism]
MLVETGKGFVEEQNFWLQHERAGEGDALLLPAGELADMAIAIAAKANEFEHGFDLALDLICRNPTQLEAEGKVLEHVHMRPQRMALEYHTGGALFWRQMGDVFAINGDEARAWAFKATNHAQQRGLAGAGWAEKAYEFTIGYIERESVDRPDIAGSEDLGDVFDIENGHFLLPVHADRLEILD